jgi:hypothetical protein
MTHNDQFKQAIKELDFEQALSYLNSAEQSPDQDCINDLLKEIFMLSSMWVNDEHREQTLNFLCALPKKQGPSQNALDDIVTFYLRANAYHEDQVESMSEKIILFFLTLPSTAQQLSHPITEQAQNWLNKKSHPLKNKPIPEIQQNFNQELTKLTETKRALLDRGKLDEARQIHKLYEKISRAANSYFSGVQNIHSYIHFKQTCDEAISLTRLQTQTDLQQILTNILLLIASIGSAYFIAKYLHDPKTGPFSFFATHEEKQLNAIEYHMDQLEPTLNPDSDFKETSLELLL